MTRYLELSRTHSYSLLLALPLFLVYEAGVIWLADGSNSTLRNGADALLRSLLSITGVGGTAALAGVVALSGIVLIVRERRKKSVRLHPVVFLAMLAESAVYALLLGMIVGTATQELLDAIPVFAAQTPFAGLSFSEAAILSVGAGLYEELVFRVLIAGGLFVLFQSNGATRWQAGLFAVILSALLFSGFHYIGPLGDEWMLASFLFRFLAGMAFSLLFLLRGFGITAWTHALYDLLLLATLSG